ncbi:asialoglycoprotein receptor 1-like isoform X1 [Embiotoca jacksoni]|uniref:asialoglycoprotein receptor 1-like isoform X1 n=1 Tax=Embiotoca jacksoni TaxID=100190 RepID=UPI003704028C
MEGIYDNVEDVSSAKLNYSRIQPGPRSTKKSFHLGVIVSLGLLSVFLLAGLITLGVHYHHSAAGLLASEDRVSSMTEERDLLNTSLTEMTKQLDRIRTQSTESPRSTKKNFHLGVIVSLGLLSVFLLAGIITLGVHYRCSAAGLLAMTEERDLLNTSLTEMTKQLDRVRTQSTENRRSAAGLLAMTKERDLLNTSLTEMTKQLDRIRTQSTENRRSAAGLLASEDRVSSMTEERDLLNTSLTEMTKQLDRIRTQSTEKKKCPEGWTIFRFSCYRRSELSGSWDTGREDCRDKAAHLVVIESLEEQEFLSTFTKLPVWIGLNDKETEGTWKWIDGTPLTFTHWETNQPDEWLPHAGGEDCAQIREPSRQWNDVPCETSMNWICEEPAKSCRVF